MLARLHFQFIHHLLNIRNLLSQGAYFLLLSRGLHASLDHQSAVLGGSPNALIVQIFMGFDWLLLGIKRAAFL